MKIPNLIYITDKEKFLLDGKSMLNDKKAANVLSAFEYPSSNETEIYAYLEDLKLTGVSSKALKSGKVKLIDVISKIYNNVPPLPFKWYVENGDTLLFKRVPSPTGQEFKKVNGSNFETFYTALKEDDAAYETFNNHYYGCPELLTVNPRPEFKDFMHAIYNYFIDDFKYKLKTIPVLLTHDEQVPAFKYFDPSTISPGPTPAWDQFLSRLDFPDVFLAWVFCLFDPVNEGRQILWIQGNGHDGKSTIMRAIMKIYGERYVASLTQGSIDNQFFFSQVYGKRFVVYGDCTNERLVSMGKVQSLTGGDNVPIEFKGETAFTSKIYGRLMVCSNYHPSIDFSKNNEKSRILRLVVHKNKGTGYIGDPLWEHNLVAEGPHLLFKAKAAYNRLVPNSMNINVPSDLWELMQAECGSEESDITEEFIQEHLKFDETAWEPVNKIVSALELFVGVRNKSSKVKFIKDDLYKVLNKKGIVKNRKIIDGKKLRVFQGLRLTKAVAE